MVVQDKGLISEWNEGTFLMIRLHEIQEEINFYKSRPLEITQGKFNYEWYARKVMVLMGEGYSKYDNKERENVNKIRKLIFWSLEHNPPCFFKKESSIVAENKNYTFDSEIFNNFMELCWSFESIVKDYNEKHGLKTKNQKAGGWFGG